MRGGQFDSATVGFRVLGTLLVVVMLAGCATMREPKPGYDKTKKSAGIGAAAGAVLGAVLGEGEADEILAGAAIGAGIGAGIGVYMDKQEARIEQINGASVDRVDDDKLLVNFASDVLFAVDSFELTPTSRRTLDDFAGVVREYHQTAVVVQGHTDSTGSDEHNQRLSERRANAVKVYLVGAGVAPSRLVAIGYGEHQPVAPNDTADGRRLNRRVDILLKGKA